MAYPPHPSPARGGRNPRRNRLDPESSTLLGVKIVRIIGDAVSLQKHEKFLAK
jgi:hypothetical protein